MSKISETLQYLADHSCIRRDSKKFKRAREQVMRARDPLDCAVKLCVKMHREKAQEITSDIWDHSRTVSPLWAVEELEKAARVTFGGYLDPTHHDLLNRLRDRARVDGLTRGVFVKLGGEVFRMAAYLPDKGSSSAWRDPDIRGFRYRTS